MKKTTKVLLVTSAVSFFATGANIAATETVLAAEITPLITEHLLPKADLATLASSEQLPEANPLASVGTGWTNKFKKTTQETDGKIRLTTQSNSLFAVGMDVKFQTGFKFDEEIAGEFFSTPGWEKYVTGTIERFDTMLPINKTVKIEKLFAPTKGERMFYDKDSKSLMYNSPAYLFSGTQYVNVDMFIDLATWHTHTNRLVERKPFYKFAVSTQATDTWFNPSWGAAETALTIDYEDSWIENKVKPSTLVTDDDKEFSGVAKQDSRNQHDSVFTGELYINGTLVKNRIPIDKNGKWSTNIGSLASDSDEISFRVVATEREENGNGVMNIRYSELVYYTIGNSLPYLKWEVAAPTLQQLYDGETAIFGTMPRQNKQNKRTYNLLITVNGAELSDKVIDGTSGEFAESLIDTALVKGDTVTAQIIGHEKGLLDKKSEVITTIVQENQDGQESWDNWTVNKPTLDTPNIGDYAISGNVPLQNKFNGRTYEIVATLNNKEIGRRNISSLGGDFMIALSKKEEDLISLKEKDKVAVYVIGHEKDENDKKSTQVTATVKDNTDYSEWKVNKPTIQEKIEAEATTVAIEIPEQNGKFSRSYDLNVLVDGTLVKTLASPPTETLTVTLETALVEGQVVTAEIVGHQPAREDKISEQDSVTVIAKDTHAEWEVKSPTIADITVGDASASVTSPEQDLTKERTYDVELMLNGKPLTTEAINSAETITIDLTSFDLVAEDLVSATIIGHEANHDDKRSDTVETVVIAKETPTQSRFVQGYWQSFGLVYEGEIDNESWTLDNPEGIRKVVRIINEKEETQSTLDAFNTNWYNPERYSGYQFILSNTILGQLTTGNFTLVMDVYIDDQLVATTPLNPTNGMRSGAIHEKYQELEQTVINYNFIKPVILNNQPGFTITKNDPAAKFKLVNKYWSDEEAYGLVFDGYIPADVRIPSTGHNKNLIVTDKTGAVVFSKDILDAVETNWETAMDVPLENVFQATIPREFSDEASYTYTIKVTDANGSVLIEGTLNTK